MAVKKSELAKINGGKREADPLFIQAIAKGMDVLRCVGQSTEPVSVSDLAVRTGLTQPNVWRICYTLRILGYLTTTASGSVAPGLPLLGLGYAALSTDSVHKIAKPFLTELATRFRAASGIAIRDGLSMLYLERSDGDAMLTINLRPGSTVPLLASAMGWAYLAGTSEEERTSLLEQIRREEPKRWATNIKPFEDAYRSAKSEGFILCSGIYHPAVAMVGTTLRHPTTGMLFSLNCGGLSSQFTPTLMRRSVGPALLRAAEQMAPLFASVRS